MTIIENSTRAKRAYKTPTLVQHGDVEVLTQTYGHYKLTPQQLDAIRKYLKTNCPPPPKCPTS